MPAEELTESPPRKSGDGGDRKHPTKPTAYRRSPRVMRTFIGSILLLFLLAGVAALVLYLVYRPSKPRFAVVGAAIYDLNVTAPTVVFSDMQITVTIRNPNARSTISYDRMAAYVSLGGQPLTPPLRLPPLEQDEKSTVVMSPVFGGVPVAVSPEVAAALAAAETYGVVALRLVVAGRIRYNPGPFHSGRVGMHVRCDLMAAHRRGMSGQVPLLAAAGCWVDA
ncbi:NDR1/HIN1-like protein 1 [Wolffia australiana]